MRSPWNIPARLALGLLVAAVVLALLEGASRLWWGAPVPTTMVFHERQLHGGYLRVEGDRVNPLYQRGNPVGTFPRVTGEPRLAFLGGSSVHGKAQVVPPLDTSQEFAQVVEDLTGVDTVNLGSPGLDTFDLVPLVEELLEHTWTGLVIYAGHNDFGNIYFHRRFDDTHQRLALRAMALFERLQVFHRLRAAIDAQAAASFLDLTGEHREGRPDPVYVTMARKRAALDLYRNNLSQILDLATNRGLEVCLVTPVGDLTRGPAAEECVFEPCAQDLWTEGMERVRAGDRAGVDLLREARDRDPVPLRAPSWVAEVVRNLGRGPGVQVVDAERELPRSDLGDFPSESLFSDHVHFNAAGHRALARLIAPVAKDLARPSSPHAVEHKEPL